VDQCWEVIDKETEEAVKSEDLATIERSLLEVVIERDTLNIEEIELFKAVNLWATKRCEKQGSSTNGSEKRRILGERIVKGIRFPVMAEHEFASVVLDSQILTPEEALKLFKYFNSVPDTPVGFPETKRTGLKELFERCHRFGSVAHTGSGYPYSPDKQDCLIFKVDKDISLLGVTLFGSKHNTYSVTIKITRLDYEKCLQSKPGKFSSALMKYKSVSYYGFNIFFDQPVSLKKSVEYRVEASISGSNSWFGQNGQDHLLCSGVRFKFRPSSYSTNGTNVERGQFSEFLFTVK